MSLGYGASAVLETQNEQTAVYRYGGYNWNIAEYRNPEHILDGYIRIKKSALAEPEIHEKIKRLPNGKKQRIVKRIPLFQPVDEPLRTGQFQIENCSFCWKLLDEQYDILAIQLLGKICEEYQQTGSLPKHTSLMY